MPAPLWPATTCAWSVSIAKRYLRVAGPHLTLEDPVSFGSIGLLQGIDKFDPAKSGKLSTYVTWWIRQAVGATEGLTRERARQVIVGAISKLRGDPVIAAYAKEVAES